MKSRDGRAKSNNQSCDSSSRVVNITLQPQIVSHLRPTEKKRRENGMKRRLGSNWGNMKGEGREGAKNTLRERCFFGLSGRPFQGREKRGPETASTAMNTRTQPQFAVDSRPLNFSASLSPYLEAKRMRRSLGKKRTSKKKEGLGFELDRCISLSRFAFDRLQNGIK